MNNDNDNANGVQAQFWEIIKEREAKSPGNLPKQHFPIETIKHIMKAEIEASNVVKVRKGKGTVKFQIAKEVLHVLEMACEMFVRDITARAWEHTSDGDRKKLKESDILAAVNETDVMDFLVLVLAPESVAGL